MFNLSALIGPVDQYSALVLIAIAVTLCIIITTAIAKRRGRREVENEFELAKLKQADAHSEAMYIRETTRGVEFKKVDQGLITSHRETGSD